MQTKSFLKTGLLAAFALWSVCVQANQHIELMWTGPGVKIIYIGVTAGKQFTINWGNGTVETKTGDGTSIWYASPSYGAGTYLVEITGSTTDSHIFNFNTFTATGITTLNVSQADKLERLTFAGTQLTSVNLSSNPALRFLNCYDNQLTSLNLNSNPALTFLDCSYNQITSLNLNSNMALDTLSCHDNLLNSLNVSNNTALKLLLCHANQLSSLDVSRNTALSILQCHDNKLTSLDVSKNTALSTLYCHYNKLTTLNVTGATALMGLYCDNNQLTTLGVSGNAALAYLHCYNNHLPLSELYQASQRISDPDKKRLGVHTLSYPSIPAGGAFGTGQNSFGGIETVYSDVKRDGNPAVEGTHYSIVGGTIRFLTPGAFTFVSANAAIVSHPDYPASVAVSITVTEGPTVSSLLPADGATNVGLNAEVSVTFNRNIGAGNLSGITINGAPATASISGNRLAISHAAFNPNTLHTVNIPAGTVIAYNEPISWSFTTEADIEVVELAPANGAAGVALNADVAVTFNRYITIGNPGGITINGVAAAASVSGNNLILSHADFNPNTFYMVNVPGNAVNGYSEAIIWSFTTGEGMEELTVAGLTPANGATGVFLNNEVAVTFNKNIAAGNLGGITVNGAAAYPSISGNKLIINHADFNPNTFYFVNVPAGTVNGYEEAITWGFTTGTETGISDISEERIAVYPNPTTGQLTITMGQELTLTGFKTLLEFGNIAIYDMFGRMVFVETQCIALQQDNTITTIGERSRTIDISHLPTGVYFLRIETAGGTVTKKIIKN